MTELKPCPFCGGTDIHIEETRDPNYDIVISGHLICYDCLSVFTQAEACCEEDIIAAWNRRTQT